MRTCRMLIAALLFTGCQLPDGATTAPTRADPPAPRPAAFDHAAHRSAFDLAPDALGRVREATARYRDVEQAKADGYRDLGVVLPNMGHHFLKDELRDGRFEADRPELLVYSAHDNGRLELVAVEYAIPRELSATAPEGFPGAEDVWFDDPVFHLWTLHVWVWKTNPDGIFTATNRTVP